jgi:hypothetical protein
MTLQLDSMYLWDDGFKKLQWQLQTSCCMYLNDNDVLFLQMTLLTDWSTDVETTRPSLICKEAHVTIVAC